MTDKFETLVVLADGAQARGLAERRRHGPLTELAAWTLTADELDRRADPRRDGRVDEGAGRGGDAVLEAPPAEAAEKRFLQSVAERINRSAAAGEFEHLVLIAPPRALGVLRQALKPAVARRVEVSEAHERIKATPDEVRTRLRDLRIPDR